MRILLFFLSFFFFFGLFAKTKNRRVDKSLEFKHDVPYEMILLSSTITHTVLVSIAGTSKTRVVELHHELSCCPRLDSLGSFEAISKLYLYLFTYTFLLFKVGIFGYL